MSNGDSPRVRDEIRREASSWFVELNENPQDQTIREGFDRWLRRSPEHVHAFLQISAHWEEGTPRPGALVESVDDLIALAKLDSNLVRLAPQGGTISAAAEERAIHEASGTPQMKTAGVHAQQFWRQRRFALAASFLLSVVAGALVWQQSFRGVYSTGIGEQRSLTLTDGSTVDLNSRSRIRVRYAQEERHIDLLEGQALFHVAKNRLQPFVVQSGSTQVRAVGTQFDVYRKENGTIVTVVEGRVAVIPVTPSRATADESAEQSTAAHLTTSGRPVESKTHELAATGAEDEVFLDAGEQITLGPRPAVNVASARPEPADIEAVTAWTQHRLIFRGAPLSEVVSEFNRYSERPMIITDAEISATRISGSFSSSDPADLLRFLREVGAYDVRETPSQVAISRK
jgi:transmembrane sensor